MDPMTEIVLRDVLPLLFIVLLVRRNLRARKLRVEQLWSLPTVILLVTAYSLATRPPTTLLTIVGLPLALIAGGAIGWWRGRLTNIIVDPETHALTSRPSPLGLVLIGVLFIARYGLRSYLEQSSPHADLSPALLEATDGLLMFSVGLIGVQRLEMWQRAKRMLAESIAAKKARSITPPNS